ncbi:MAG TPA: alpha/beta fold hydrolase [Candidatus Binataceae bacterium]|jgi:3-oxoadipate enol-lactonase/4-carboxymuconolactone decarboxylase|nr:alpha/beta fold hydrolase [Candidatus Binataceae bacterium]
MPTKYVEVQGCATYYYYVGRTTLPDVAPDFSRGRTLILLHGAGSNGHTWHNQLAHLGRSHSPLAIDFPAHGRSSGVEGLKSIQDYSDFTVAFMDAVGIRSAVIGGRSMGGAIAMDMALRYPARVEAIVPVVTAAKFNIPAARVEGLRAVAMGRAPQAFVTDGYSPATIKDHFEIIREGWMEQIQTDPRVRYTDILACNACDLREQIARIDKPTLILAGADDPITPPADAEFIRSRIRGAQLRVVANAGHHLPNEQAAETSAALESFLAQ